MRLSKMIMIKETVDDEGENPVVSGTFTTYDLQGGLVYTQEFDPGKDPFPEVEEAEVEGEAKPKGKGSKAKAK